MEEVTATTEAYRRITDHLAEVARIERLSLEAGIGVQSEYLRAEARLAEARARLASLEHEQTLSLIRLAEASGTLTLEWLEQLVENSP